MGSADGVSVIGWEPDTEFDHIESAWSMLGDMKVVNKKLVIILTINYLCRITYNKILSLFSDMWFL